MRHVIVIGLGIFGFNLVRELFENGLEVIAIDKNKDMVQRVRDTSTKAIVADGTEKEILDSIGIHEDDVVIISFGEDLAASALITLHLRQMGVKRIVVKVPNEDHQRVLEKVGATEVIIPEKEMAHKVARSLVAPNVIDFLPLTGNYMISEVAPPKSFFGKTIRDLHLRAKYHVDVIAVKDIMTDSVTMIPGAAFVVKDTDILVVMGKEEDLTRMSEA
jgi:trk system potassium uptake protein